MRQQTQAEEPKGMFTIEGEPKIVQETRRMVLQAFEDLEFIEEGHRYFLNGKEIESSVSSIGHRFIREPFDAPVQAARYAQKHGETAEYWLQKWKDISLKATTLGTKTHEFGESLSYLRAGHPELMRASARGQYVAEKHTLTPSHPKEEAVLKFHDSLSSSLHLVINEAMVYSGKNPDPSRNLSELICGTFDMLYYYDGEGNPANAGFMIFDYKTNSSLVSEYCKRWGKMLLPPFSDMIEQDLSLYTIQLSLYALMLEDIGIPIVGRNIVWLTNEGNYQVIPVPDVSERLRSTIL